MHSHLSFLVSQPLPPARHLSQQSMPFHSGEGTNGNPAESVAAGGEQRLFCGADSNLPSPACTGSLYICRCIRWRDTLTHLQNKKLYILAMWRRDGGGAHSVSTTLPTISLSVVKKCNKFPVIAIWLQSDVNIQQHSD